MVLQIVHSAGRWLQLCRDGLFSRSAKGARYWRRLTVMLWLIPVSGIALSMHWLCMLLDEILFRAYRKVQIQSPVFITGVPRSGTTFLHRLLAEDSQFTTFSTWECLFAPSITQKKIILSVAKLDAKLGGKLKRLVESITRAAAASLEDIHATRLDAPEEDYFVFMPLLLCFILVVVFPAAGFIWRMGFFDKAMSTGEKRRLMGYYRACLQKHLFVFGQDKVLLSKNASFASMVHALADEFPQARFIYCLRDPIETVPSQLSSVRDTMIACGNDPDSAGFREQMVELLSFYYQNVLHAISQARTRHSVVNMESLRIDLQFTIASIYRQLALTISPDFKAALLAKADQAKSFKSTHAYTAHQFGYDEKTILRRFAHVYEHPRYQDAKPEAEAARAPVQRKWAGGV